MTLHDRSELREWRRMGFQPVLVAENKELNGFWLPHDLLDPHESPSRMLKK